MIAKLPDKANMRCLNLFPAAIRLVSRRLATRAVLAAFAFAVSSSGLAGSEGKTVATPYVSARLVASADAVAPGERITLGIAKKIIPKWHTYWQNPGDSGLATQVEWTLPEGAEAGPIQWPAPERHSLGPVVNYGYEGEVTLLSEVTVPADAQPGQTLAVRADVSWLVCSDICIPEDVTLEVALPVTTTGGGTSHPAIQTAQARLPTPSPWPARFQRDDAGLRLAVDTGPLPQADAAFWFYPFDWGVVDHSAAQRASGVTDGLILDLPPGQGSASLDAVQGVLVITERSADGELRQAFEISASPGTVAALPPAPATPAESGISLPLAIVFALAGGLILNLMPCVFPVLAMKALALVRHGHASRTVARTHGLAYLGGVLASFAVLAAVVLALQAGGTRLGWGFQFQSPMFVLLVAWLLFGVGLNLSGVFTLGGGSFAGAGQSLSTRDGYSGSFFTGVLAAVVATPCTAPFMGAAIGFAMAQPPATLAAIFLALGFGLALPFVALAWWPALLRLLPKPGMWMERLKQALAFPMYGAAVWLVWVLALQRGADGVLIALGGMVAIAIAAWLYDVGANAGNRPRHLARAATAALLVVTIASGNLLMPTANAGAADSSSQATSSGGPPAEVWSEQRLADLRREGRPVFVNFTAAWCITCLVNERIALSQPAVIERFAADEIVYLKGDWTDQDEKIAEALARFGRSGVPLYLYYPADPGLEPRVLPQILTPDTVLRAIDASAAGKA